MADDKAFRKKVGDTRRYHAAALGLSVDVLETQYGWSLDRMLLDAKQAYANHCPYCPEPKPIQGPRGLANLSLDHLDPTRPPFYKTNFRWVCMDCNRRKYTSSGEEFAQQTLAPVNSLPLFDLTADPAPEKTRGSRRGLRNGRVRKHDAAPRLEQPAAPVPTGETEDQREKRLRREAEDEVQRSLYVAEILDRWGVKRG